MTGHQRVNRVRIVYEFMGGWQRCMKCGRTLALIAPGKPKRHVCDSRIPDQKWATQ